MVGNEKKATEEEYRAMVSKELIAAYGYIIPASALVRILGFRTYDAFKRALQRQTLTIPLSTVPGRRARHAMTNDVVDWLVAQWLRSRKTTSSSNRNGLRQDQILQEN